MISKISIKPALTPMALPISMAIVPKVSLLDPKLASKQLQQIKYERVNGLIGGPSGR
ncbi:MAG: hypothetical protein HY730_00335 [Candidatus Tectomicrobia bacterium]|uniref:Uncharacterized protein n=1 Tax=Tectimicrobiota bacterium TaxID=2528274 RepID=A0A933LP63_UNCTE|nr:hypothetical protein [Candidatus Tectomicrobia bacterium]